ncbi:MAG TPA: flagellar motor switch protein FliM [Erysipelotrichaceae bacterium]|nr:flagellar motor switch protein FliM [Erysipelotrichaceae bacterium]
MNHTYHETGENIRKYDFRSPKKFGKEQLRTIEDLHETFVRNLSSYLSALTRLYCEVQITHIEKQRYYEYINTAQELAVCANFDITPLDETLDEISMLVTINPDIGYFLIDKLLGGSGEEVKVERDFTEIECALLENIFGKLTRQIEMSWMKQLEIEARMKSLETNPRVIQLMMPEEIVLVVECKVILGDLNSSLKLLLPSVLFETLMEKFTPKFIRNTKRHDESKEEIQKNAILNSLKGAEVELKVVLDEIEIDLHDILQLEVNDIIPLSKRFDSNVTLNVDDNPWFEAKLGETKQRKAVKIERLIEKEK